VSKFFPALAALAVIALLAWKTITDEKLRYAVWIIVGFIAVRIILMEQRKRIESGEQGKEGRE
jgi:phosphatidylserine synthase